MTDRARLPMVAISLCRRHRSQLPLHRHWAHRGKQPVTALQRTHCSRCSYMSPPCRLSSRLAVRQQGSPSCQLRANLQLTLAATLMPLSEPAGRRPEGGFQCAADIAQLIANFSHANDRCHMRPTGALDPLLPSTDQQSGHPAASTIRATTVITALFCVARSRGAGLSAVVVTASRSDGTTSANCAP